MRKTSRWFFKMSVCLCILWGIPLLGIANPVVKWVYMEDAQPINWLEKGVAKGIEVEIVEHVLAKLGIQVVHEFYPWSRAQERVEKGLADAMMTTPTPKRFQYALFGKENVLPNYWNLFIQKENTTLASKVGNFTKLEDLKPYTLVDFIGNGWKNAFMKQEQGYKIEEVSRLEQIPVILANGRSELAINSSTWINWWADKQGVGSQIQEFEVDWPWTRFHFVFMVSRKSAWIDKGLIRAMDREAKAMKASGVWQAILRKYKNPHGFGRPFRSHLNADYLQKNGFYQEYDGYPTYQP